MFTALGRTKGSAQVQGYCYIFHMAEYDIYHF